VSEECSLYVSGLPGDATWGQLGKKPVLPPPPLLLPSVPA